MKKSPTRERNGFPGRAALAVSTIAAVSGWSLLAQAATVTSIHFQNGSSTSEIDITTDSPITYDEQQNASDKQLVIDLKGTSLSKTAGRQMDTSSFDSKVLLISPYEVGGGSKDSRVVVQLRDMVTPTVSQQGNTLTIKVPNAAGAAANAQAQSEGQNASEDQTGSTPAESAGPEDMPPASPSTDLSSTSPDAQPSAGPEAQVGATTTTAEGTASQAANIGIKDKLGQFIESRETRHFVGKPISLRVRDADIADIFRLIGDASGFNIVVGEDVKGKITLALQDVPWDQALDVVLTTEKLGAERNHNVLRIVTLDELTKEKKEELAAQQATEASAPRVTRVFPISYAKLDDLTSILTKFASSAQQPTPAVPSPLGFLPLGAAPAAAAAAASSKDMYSAVVADARTNSIIVRDTAANIARMEKLIELLDTQTPQVLIEAKVIEATENFSNSIGGQIGFGNGTSNSQWYSSFAGADPIDPLFSVGTGNSVYTNGAQAGAAASGGSFGISPQLAFLPSNIRLNAILNLSEAEDNLRIISSPKSVVMDKEKATILESTPVLTLVTSQTSTGPVLTPTVQQADLSLDVTPTVTNEGSVLMQLTVSDDVPANVGTGTANATQAVASRNITTRVLVESGSTLVMGGIYTMNKEDSSSGFPILRKIPILGALFGQDATHNDRTELFFFITPRILNLKESGITS